MAKLVAALLFTLTTVFGVMLPLPPFTLGVTAHVFIGTLHAVADVLVPVALPLHPHVHGPVPATAVAVPVLHRFADGATRAGVALLAEPHAPFTAPSVKVAVTAQLASSADVV